ncbi:MAG: hypothetical protein M3N22_07410, partial [Acidobacteriota bacterium]|nr:hypothetical protein [Acidobacteriota bacterium]
KRDSPDEIATRVMTMSPGRRFFVLYEFRVGGAGAAGGTSSGNSRNSEVTSGEAVVEASRPTLFGKAVGALTGASATRRPAKKKHAPGAELLRQALMDLQKRGFNRLYQDGRVHEFSSPETLLDVDFSRPVYVLVDRLSINPEARSRLVDSVEICYREGNGEAILEFVADAAGQAERLTF